MNKKLQELRDTINAKADIVESLINDGKFEDAVTAKAELETLHNQYEALKDVFEKIPDTIHKPKAPETKDSTALFANAARAGFKNTLTEGTPKDGGYTVPEDIQTKINKFREAEFNLGQLVSTETVTTETGARTYQKKKKAAGFSKVGEGGKIQAAGQPEFFRLSYTISKYGGYMPVTSELLEDSDANIERVIVEWLGKESRATRNNLIIDAIERGKGKDGATPATYTPIKGIDGITKALNITLGSAYKNTSTIITNDYGLQVLCELKDANGRPLLNPNPSDPAKMQLSAGATVIPVKVIPAEVLSNFTVKGKVYPPIIIGDLKEGITLFNRKSMQIKSSDVASVTGLSAFEEDMTLFRGLERLDVEPKDTDAYVLGYMADGEVTAEAA